jgi:hypothetical protein
MSPQHDALSGAGIEMRSVDSKSSYEYRPRTSSDKQQPGGGGGVHAAPFQSFVKIYSLTLPQ